MLNLRLCHWSIQLFDLRAPSSTDVSVLLPNQPNVLLVATRRREPWKRGCKTPTSLVLNFFFLSLLDYIERGKLRTLSSSREVVRAVFSPFSSLKRSALESLKSPPSLPLRFFLTFVYLHVRVYAVCLYARTISFT